MTKLCVLHGTNTPRYGGKSFFGMEVECEGSALKLPSPEGSNWTVVRDGSLRGVFPTEAAEFIFSKPLSLLGSVKAINELVDLQKNAELKFSFRTSVHTHMNVLDLTAQEVSRIIYTYYLLEPLLMDYCGKTRRGNRFCVELKDSGFLQEQVTNFIKFGFKRIHNLSEAKMKYSSLNLYTMNRHGTIEFRGMRGTLDKEVLVTWLKMLDHLRSYAISSPSMEAIAKDFTSNPPAVFVEKALGRSGQAVIKEDINNKLAHSFSLTFPFIVAEREVNKELEKKPKIKPIKEGRNQGIPGRGVLIQEDVMEAVDRDLARQEALQAVMFGIPAGQMNAQAVGLNPAAEIPFPLGIGIEARAQREAAGEAFFRGLDVANVNAPRPIPRVRMPNLVIHDEVQQPHDLGF